MDSRVKRVVFWIVIVLSAVLLWTVVKNATVINEDEKAAPEISYSDFLSQIESRNVKKVVVSKTLLRGTYRDGRAFRVFTPPIQDAMLEALHSAGVEIWFTEHPSEGGWASVLTNLLPVILLAALWFFMIRSLQGVQTRLKAVSANGKAP